MYLESHKFIVIVGFRRTDRSTCHSFTFTCPSIKEILQFFFLLNQNIYVDIFFNACPFLFHILETFFYKKLCPTFLICTLFSFTFTYFLDNFFPLIYLKWRCSLGWISNVFFYKLLIIIRLLLFEIRYFSAILFSFSHTFERIKVNSEKLWHFEMYTVTNDFEWRPMTPYVLYPFEFGYRLWQRLRKSKKSIV